MKNLLKNPTFLGTLIAVFWFAVGTYAFNSPPSGCTPGSCASPLRQDFVNDSVGIGTEIPQATLDVNGFMRLATNVAEPVTCDASVDGSIALTSGYEFCVCVDGAGWLRLAAAAHIQGRSSMSDTATLAHACNW